MDTEYNNQAEELFSKLGMNLTTAVIIFVRQSVREGGIPFEVSLESTISEQCFETRIYGNEVQKQTSQNRMKKGAKTTMNKRIIAMLVILSVLTASFPAGAVYRLDRNDTISNALLEEESLEIEDVYVQAIVRLFEISTSCKISQCADVVITQHFIKTTENLPDGSKKSDYYSAIQDGEMVDLGRIAQELRTTYTVTSHNYITQDIIVNNAPKSDFYLSFTVYFAYAINYINPSEGYRFYRPYKIEGSWYPANNNSISMGFFSLDYISYGWEVCSPECLNSSLTYNELEALVTDEDGVHEIPTSATNLMPYFTISRTKYMNSGRALWFAYPQSMHGSIVEFECQYTCNGNAYSGSLEAVIGAYYE